MEQEFTKPKDHLIINPINEGYEIEEERTHQIHFIPNEDIEPIEEIIENLDLNYIVGYRYIVRKLLQKLNLNISIDAFNGGKNRARFYFRFYYYPLKILEAKGIINYYGRGGIERII